MKQVGWAESDLVYRVLDDPPADFDCGSDEQNDYLHSQAAADQEAGVSVTYIAYVKGTAAAFVTILSDSLQLYPFERGADVGYTTVPAMKIGQLGVDRRWQGLGLATRLIVTCIATARHVSGIMGLRYATVDAKPHVIEFYTKLGFKMNKLEKKLSRQDAEERGLDPSTLPVSMRFDLRIPNEQLSVNLPQSFSQ